MKPPGMTRRDATPTALPPLLLVIVRTMEEGERLVAALEEREGGGNKYLVVHSFLFFDCDATW